jgi:hypothetical protein
MAAALATTFEALVDLFPICFQSTPARSESADTHAHDSSPPNHPAPGSSPIYRSASARPPPNVANTTSCALATASVRPVTVSASLSGAVVVPHQRARACTSPLFGSASAHSPATTDASAQRYKSDSSSPCRPQGDSSPPPPPGTSRERAGVSPLRAYNYPCAPPPCAPPCLAPVLANLRTEPHTFTSAPPRAPARLCVGPHSPRHPSLHASYRVACVSPKIPCLYLCRSAPRSSSICARKQAAISTHLARHVHGPMAVMASSAFDTAPVDVKTASLEQTDNTAGDAPEING